jgi:hypothetical protein
MPTAGALRDGRLFRSGTIGLTRGRVRSRSGRDGVPDLAWHAGCSTRCGENRDGRSGIVRFVALVFPVPSHDDRRRGERARRGASGRRRRGAQRSSGRAGAGRAGSGRKSERRCGGDRGPIGQGVAIWWVGAGAPRHLERTDAKQIEVGDSSPLCSCFRRGVNGRASGRCLGRRSCGAGRAVRRRGVPFRNAAVTRWRGGRRRGRAGGSTSRSRPTSVHEMW